MTLTAKAPLGVLAFGAALLALMLGVDVQRCLGQEPDSRPSDAAPEFSHETIPPLAVNSDGHVSVAKNGVQFEVYFDKGPKTGAVIYACNTGRPQLVLTPEKHQAILQDLIHRRFTVILADFKNKRLTGLELEHYVCQLTSDAREAADGKLHPSSQLRPPLATAAPAVSATETYTNDYYVLMPGFTVQREIEWFRYADIPEPFRREIARQVGKPFQESDGAKTNTYDVIYPVHGPAVPVLTHYCHDEHGRQDYYPLETRYLVMAFAFKNMAIVHQQYFNDPVGGYHKGYDYYGDQFAACFVRHLKGHAAQYHIDPRKICCFGCSKGSEVPGMLVNKLRGSSPYLFCKADAKKVALAEEEKRIPSPFSEQTAEIACAVLGAGIANQDLQSDALFPWQNDPAKNISPFFIYADHRAPMRMRTNNVVAKAKAGGVYVESAELEAHTWPYGDAYDKASAFVDRILQIEP